MYIDKSLKNMNKCLLPKTVITFNQDRYDPTIDYLKGLCILFVVMQHSMSPLLHRYILFALWGRFAVPLFILIQVFHAYKRIHEGKEIAFSFGKVWHRVIKPFLLVQVLLLIYTFLFTEKSIWDIIEPMIYTGGMGSGGYYPCIYVQFAIVLPLLAPIFKKYGDSPYLLIAFIVLSQLLEVACCLLSMPEWLYRLCGIRYFFIVYLGYILVTKGFSLNTKNTIIAVISFFFVIFFSLFDYDLRPLFYTGSPAWKQCHWICYFYMCYLLLGALLSTYYLMPFERLKNYVKLMGKYSYEIFMFQMLYFHLAMRVLPFFDGQFLRFIYMLLSVLICIVPVVYYKSRINAIKINKN